MLTLTALVFSMTLVVLQPVPVRGRSHGKERMVGSRRLDGPARTDLDEVYRRNDLLGPQRSTSPVSCFTARRSTGRLAPRRWTDNHLAMAGRVVPRSRSGLVEPSLLQPQLGETRARLDAWPTRSDAAGAAGVRRSVDGDRLRRGER